ncbi:hypothetical protein EsH8_XV_000031 [Colletotrichum jinshuiense]
MPKTPDLASSRPLLPLAPLRRCNGAGTDPGPGPDAGANDKTRTLRRRPQAETEANASPPRVVVQNFVSKLVSHSPVSKRAVTVFTKDNLPLERLEHDDQLQVCIGISRQVPKLKYAKEAATAELDPDAQEFMRKKQKGMAKADSDRKLKSDYITFLDNTWGSREAWLPIDVYINREPGLNVLASFRNITKEALRRNTPLSDLWDQGGILREAATAVSALGKTLTYKNLNEIAKSFEISGRGHAEELDGENRHDTEHAHEHKSRQASPASPTVGAVSLIPSPQTPALGPEPSHLEIPRRASTPRDLSGGHWLDDASLSGSEAPEIVNSPLFHRLSGADLFTPENSFIVHGGSTMALDPDDSDNESNDLNPIVADEVRQDPIPSETEGTDTSRNAQHQTLVHVTASPNNQGHTPVTPDTPTTAAITKSAQPEAEMVSGPSTAAAGNLAGSPVARPAITPSPPNGLLSPPSPSPSHWSPSAALQTARSQMADATARLMGDSIWVALAAVTPGSDILARRSAVLIDPISIQIPAEQLTKAHIPQLERHQLCTAYIPLYQARLGGHWSAARVTISRGPERSVLVEHFDSVHSRDSEIVVSNNLKAVLTASKVPGPVVFQNAGVKRKRSDGDASPQGNRDDDDDDLGRVLDNFATRRHQYRDDTVLTDKVLAILSSKQDTVTTTKSRYLETNKALQEANDFFSTRKRIKQSAELFAGIESLVNKDPADKDESFAETSSDVMTGARQQLLRTGWSGESVYEAASALQVAEEAKRRAEAEAASASAAVDAALKSVKSLEQFLAQRQVLYLIQEASKGLAKAGPVDSWVASEEVGALLEEF